jgi:hypothetical protein
VTVLANVSTPVLRRGGLETGGTISTCTLATAALRLQRRPVPFPARQFMSAARAHCHAFDGGPRPVLHWSCSDVPHLSIQRSASRTNAERAMRRLQYVPLSKGHRWRFQAGLFALAMLLVLVGAHWPAR